MNVLISKNVFHVILNYMHNIIIIATSWCEAEGAAKASLMALMLHHSFEQSSICDSSKSMFDSYCSYSSVSSNLR